MIEDFNPKLQAFIYAVASGKTYIDAYSETYSTVGLSKPQIQHRASNLITDKVKAEITAIRERNLAEYVKEHPIEDVRTEDELTKEKLLLDLKFLLDNTKPLIFLPGQYGISKIDTKAAGIYIDAIDKAARMLGAYDEGVSDSEVVVRIEGDLEELAK